MLISYALSPPLFKAAQQSLCHLEPAQPVPEQKKPAAPAGPVNDGQRKVVVFTLNITRGCNKFNTSKLFVVVLGGGAHTQTEMGEVFKFQEIDTRPHYQQLDGRAQAHHHYTETVRQSADSRHDGPYL